MSGGAPRLIWVRAPQQARSQATLTRILDATEVLLDREPFDELNVQTICKEAGSSVGAFYARFRDKGALLHALHERICAEAKATAIEALDLRRWTDVSLGQVIETIVTFVVLEYGTRTGLRRELVRRNGFDPTFRARSVDVAAMTVTRLAVLLAHKREDLGRPDPIVAAEFAHRLIFGVLDQHTVFAETGPAGMPTTEAALSAELTTAIMAYLRTPG